MKSEKCFCLSKGLADVYGVTTIDVSCVRRLHVTNDGTNTKTSTDSGTWTPCATVSSPMRLFVFYRSFRTVVLTRNRKTQVQTEYGK